MARLFALLMLALVGAAFANNRHRSAFGSPRRMNANATGGSTGGAAGGSPTSAATATSASAGSSTSGGSGGNGTSTGGSANATSGSAGTAGAGASTGGSSPTPAPTAAPTAAPTPAPTAAPTAAPTTAAPTTAAPTTAPSAGSGAVSVNHTVKFSGTINIVAPGVTKGQMETASKKTLASHFAVPLDGVKVNATESRRLRAEMEARRLAGNWAIEYEFMATESQVADIKTKAQAMATNSSVIAGRMTTELIAAGVPADKANSISITGVTIQKSGAGGVAECFVNCPAVNSTATTSSIGETSGAHKKFNAFAAVVSVLAVLSSMVL